MSLSATSPNYREARRTLPLLVGSIAIQAFLWAFLAVLSAATPPQGAVRVTGVVLDETNSPIPGASVDLQGYTRKPLSSSETDEAGEFDFRNLTQGTYLLRVEALGFATQSLETTAGDADKRLVIRLKLSVVRDSLTVTATRSQTPVSALPNSVTLLDKETIDQQRTLADDLSSVLERTAPGFGPSLQKLAGRGESFRGRNPLYMINGVPQHNSLRDGQRDGYTIDLDFVEQVEVVHGSNSIQGVGATGGVVNMVSKAPPSDGRWRQDIRLALSGHDSFDSDSFAPKGSYFLGKKVGRFDLSGGVSLMQRDLFFDAEGRPIGLYPTQGDIMDSTQRNFYFRAGFEPTSTQRIGATVNHFQLQRDGDYVVVLGDRATGAVTSTVTGDPRPVVGDPARNRVTTASFDYRNRDLGGGDLIVQGFVQDFAARFEGGTFSGFFRLTPDGAPFLDQSEIVSDKVGFKLTYSIPENGLRGFTPRFGLDFFNDESAQVLSRSDREWVPSTTLRSFAPFLQLEQQLGRLTLAAGLRIEAARVLVDDYRTIASANAVQVDGGDPTFTEVLPNVGGVFRLGGGLSLFGSYSEGFTMPDVGRVLRGINRPGVDVDDLLDVEPIVTNNSEAGLRFSNSRVRAEASYFQSDAALGALLDADENGFFNVRRERTEISGVEFSGDVRAHDRLILGGAYSWLNGEFDSNRDGDVDSDLDGTNVAPNRLNVFAQFFAAPWLNGRIQFNNFLDRDFRGAGIREGTDFSGYTTADLMLGMETKAGLVRLGVENLFDQQYLTYFAQTEPFQRSDTIFAGRGRTWTIVFEPKFFGR